MSFLRWFGKKEASPEPPPEHSSDLGQVDATLPLNHPAHPQLPEHAGEGSHSRNERLERRELLYGVVRECMTAAGVLSSTYKFKVLSLDSSGRKYMIMVDMPYEHLASPAQFASTEGVIARSAKDRYDILVTAVYWRITEAVSASGLAPHARAVAGHKVLPKPVVVVAAATAVAAPSVQPASPYAELQKDEVLAFKRAVAAAASGAAQRGEARKLPRRNPEQVPDFSNTEPFEAPPLGPTQHGGLN